MEGDVSEKTKIHRTKVIKENHKLDFMNDLNEDFATILMSIDTDAGLSKLNMKAIKKAFKTLKS